MFDPVEIATAFNAINDKKSWKARPVSNVNLVHFDSGGLVTIILRCDDGRFMVKFNKFQAAWGDYVGSISRSLYVILNTLKAAGQPFEAPDGIDGMTIQAENTSVGNVYVSWVRPAQPMQVEMTSDGSNALGMLSTGVKNEYENNFGI